MNISNEIDKRYKDNYLKDFRFLHKEQPYKTGDIVYRIKAYNYRTQETTLDDELYVIDKIGGVDGYNTDNSYVHLYGLKSLSSNKYYLEQTPFGQYKKEWLDSLLNIKQVKPKQLSIFDME